MAGTWIIRNPSSGRGNDRETAFDAAVKRHPEVEVHVLSSPEDLGQTVKRAVADGCDLVIAAGGDGTIAGVAETIAGTDTKLGVVPMGTFNYFARSLGIPEDPAAALDAALDGEDRPMNIGGINGRIFLNNASLGAYASVLKVREDVYKTWGRSRLAAYWSVLIAMVTLYRPLKMKIDVDGKTHRLRSPMAFVGLSAFQLEEFDLEGVEDVQRGKLALFVAQDVGRLQLLWRAVRIFFRGARSGNDYILMTGEEILIETHRGTRLVAYDGEKEKMAGPYRFTVSKNALTVKVPKKSEQSAA
jgi:YegS/Rv2252/BmrU family lipid kinase